MGKVNTNAGGQQSSGWTGAFVDGDADWWKHGETICQKNKDTDRVSRLELGYREVSESVEALRNPCGPPDSIWGAWRCLEALRDIIRPRTSQT